jgi:hypothetical protein
VGFFYGESLLYWQRHEGMLVARKGHCMALCTGIRDEQLWSVEKSALDREIDLDQNIWSWHKGRWRIKSPEVKSIPYVCPEWIWEDNGRAQAYDAPNGMMLKYFFRCRLDRGMYVSNPIWALPACLHSM